MTIKEAREAHEGLRIKEMDKGVALRRIVEVITHCYHIRKITPDSAEVLTTAEIVYKQMSISYNFTPEELQLACEDAMFNQNLQRTFNCSAESIIAALRTYRSSDVFQEIIAGEKKVEAAVITRSEAEKWAQTVRSVKARLDDIRLGRNLPQLARSGAACYDDLVKHGKMGAEDWRQFEDEGREKVGKQELRMGVSRWCSDPVINAKELALMAKLQKVVDEENAELK